MDKFKKLINLHIYKWFISCARPFWKTIVVLMLLNVISPFNLVAMAIVARQMVDVAISKSVYNALGYLLLFAVMNLLHIGLNSLGNMISAQLHESMINQNQRDLVNRIYKIEWSSLNKYHSGDILTRLTSDVGNVVNFWTSQIPGNLALVFQLLVASITLLCFDMTLGIFVFVLSPVSIIVTWILGKKLKSLQHFIQEAESKCRSYIHESVQNMLIIRTFEYENESIRCIRLNQDEKYRWVLKRRNYSIGANMALGTGFTIGYCAAFIWGILRLSEGLITFGTFTAFVQLVGQVQGPFAGLSRALPQLATSLASAERLIEFEKLNLEEKVIYLGPTVGEKMGLILNHVSFGYTKERKILLDLSFRVKPYEMVGLIGVSGEGKTTFMKLLLTLIKPDSGFIHLEDGNGHRINLSPGCRSYFTYVPQGNTLFSGTIKDNLRIGKTDASEEEIREALKAACAWEFVESLPDKIDTFIGEAGMGLSEGQAQRISIARALLKNSPILLLDEATSALDVDTEAWVFENIRKMLPRRTCIVITHRLSVLPLCDRVFRLENGQIHEHQALEFETIFQKTS